MVWVFWGFAALLALVAAIIGVAIWRVVRRDRDLPVGGPRRPSAARRAARATMPRGVPKSR
jgi:hypothetical protein